MSSRGWFGNRGLINGRLPPGRLSLGWLPIHWLHSVRLLLHLEAHLRHLGMQLGVDVAPLRDPVPGQEVALAKLAELIPRQVRPLLFQEVPQIEKAEKVRFRVVEGGVDLVRRLTLLQGPLAGVLDAEGTGDHQHLRQAAQLR